MDTYTNQVSRQSCLKMLEERAIRFRKASKPSTASNRLTKKPIATALPAPGLAPAQPVVSNTRKTMELCWAESDTFQRRGPTLKNYGVTCFMNSVVQCLTYIPAFNRYLLSPEVTAKTKMIKKNPNKKRPFCMVRSMARMMRLMATTQPSQSIYPKPLVANLRNINRDFMPHQQEDAHELLVKIVEKMQKSCLREQGIREHSEEERNTIVHDIFGGRLTSRITCDTCGNISDTFSSCLDISVAIPKWVSTVEQALKHFAENEVIDGWICSVCNKRVKAKKKLFIKEAPNNLTLHLKRFNYASQKIQRHVAFKETLDLSRAMVSKKPAMYSLTGVIVHAGMTPHSGHYYAYVKDQKGKWCLMNDTISEKVNFNQISKEQGYMLFYSKAQSSTSEAKPVTSASAVLSSEPAAKKICPLQAKRERRMLKKKLRKERREKLLLQQQAESSASIIQSTPGQKCTSKDVPSVEQSFAPALVSSVVPEETSVSPLLSKKQRRLKKKREARRARLEQQQLEASSNFKPIPATAAESVEKVVSGERIRKDSDLSPINPSSKLSETEGESAMSRCLNDDQIAPTGPARKTGLKRKSSSRGDRRSFKDMISADLSKFRAKKSVQVKATPQPSVDEDATPSKKRKISLKRSDEGEVVYGDKVRSSPFNPRELRGTGVFGKDVGHWDDEDSSEALKSRQRSLTKQLLNHQAREKNSRRLDRWDEAMDTGRVKKVRTHREFTSNEGEKNPFQRALDRKRRKQD